MKEWIRLNLQAARKSKDQAKKEQWIESQDWEYVYWHGDYSNGSGGNDPLWFIQIHESLTEDIPDKEIVDRLYYDHEFEAGDDDFGISVYLVDE